ncbi:MAG: hypothetical protein JW924_12955 [Fusobacteriaceae bacterium]|nr:hypothetical protein [Fusobacteriaceae bacterium]
MLGTEFLDGQGLGNQLFCYVTARSIALEKEYKFGSLSKNNFANNIHSQKGMYFMNIDLGEDIDEKLMKKYNESQDRLFLKTCYHDMKYGCYISGFDKKMLELEDNTLVYGNMQDEKYFIKYKNQIKLWLKVKPEYETYEYSKDNLCIINMRGGEYVGVKELHLGKEYWINAIKNMKKINSKMEFMIVTEDVVNANKLLPNIPAYHFDMAKDYVVLKNAKYLIVSNSSFAFFPIFCSDTVKKVIAPKYWARHNVSDGYWASEQNIYTGWYYQDRYGILYSDSECRAELKKYLEQKNIKLNKRGFTISIFFAIALIKEKFLKFYKRIKSRKSTH